MSSSEEVWNRIASEHPEFTHDHDVTNNSETVREIVLGGSVTWAGAHERFKPFPGARVMDLGANVGIYSAFCAIHGAEVTAYEPQPITFAFLSKMIERTGLAGRIKAINSAVWRWSGQFPFVGHEADIGGDYIQYNGGLHTNGVVWTMADFKNSVPVDCISFDEAIGDTTWDCVKVDIEGAEFEILLHASLAALERIKFMYVEFHPWVNEKWYRLVIERLQAIFKFEGYQSKEGSWEAAYLSKRN